MCFIGGSNEFYWMIQCVLLEDPMCFIGGSNVFYWRKQFVLLDDPMCLVEEFRSLKVVPVRRKFGSSQSC